MTHEGESSPRVAGYLARTALGPSNKDRFDLEKQLIVPLESASHRGPEAHFMVRVGSSMHEVERELIVRTTDHTRGDKARAAEILGMSRRNLYNRLQGYATRDMNGHVNGHVYRNGRNGTS